MLKSSLLKSVTLFNNNQIPDAFENLKNVINIDPEREEGPVGILGEWL